MPKTSVLEWFVLFYSVPSHPVSSRMRLWRRLAKAGAVQLKGAVYLLPASEEHEEFLQWLIGEVRSLGGDGAFARTADIRTVSEADLKRLFTTQADEEYRKLEKAIDVLERKFQSLRKGAASAGTGRIAAEAAKLGREMADVARRDFFPSPAGQAVQRRFQDLEAGLRATEVRPQSRAVQVGKQRSEDYQARTWATRKNPFVDRMASAWLIRRFIDPQAKFTFINEQDLPALDQQTVAFDLRGGHFTHIGDLCTFEVLVRSFGIKDRAVKRIAEIVHDLDVKDDKYAKPEASGIEEILAGIRKTGRNDMDILERGMAVFEMLYQSRT